MAPSLPSCISNTFSSHKQASWFLLVTLAPFLLPFLFLSVPFLLLFLAPLSCFLLSLFFLYKVHVSIRRKRLRLFGRADKGALNKSCQSTLPNVSAQEHQEDREETKFKCTEFEELQNSNAQNMAVCTAYESGDEAVIPASVSNSEGQQQKHTEALPAHDGTTEFEVLQDSYVQSAELSAAYEAQGEAVLPSSVSDSERKKQELMEALLSHDGMTQSKTEEDREQRVHGGFLEYEGPLLSFVPVVEPSPSCKTPVEVESSENIMAYGTQKHLPLYEEGTSSHTDTLKNKISTLLPSAYEHEECSPETPYTFHDQSSVRSEHEQSSETLGGKEGLVSSHDVPDQVIEKPWKVASSEGFEFGTEEHLRQESELSCDKEPSLEHLDFATRQDDERSSSKPFEKGIQAGEPSPECIAEQRKEAFTKESQGDAQPHKDRSAKESVESFEAQWPVETEEVDSCETSSAVAKEGFAKEIQGDAQPQNDRPAKESFEAQWPVETEEGRPCETSEAMPSNMQVQGGIQFQDNIQEEQRILADINAIKKIVGYQGEPDASIMEQISAMYMFLGMEPYYWATEVEYFERARAEIELLKVVVGVK